MKEQGTWSRVVGYVEQMDIHSPALTVEESLMFSARLRLSDTMPLAEVGQPCCASSRFPEPANARLRKLRWSAPGLVSQDINVARPPGPTLVFSRLFA